MQSKKPSFASLSNEALCKLRDEIAALLNSRAEALRTELDRLTSGAAANGAAAHGAEANGKKANGKKNVSQKKGTKVDPKYRGPDGRTWAGRGLRPHWLTSAMNEGKKLEDFLIIQSEQADRPNPNNGGG